MKRTIIFFAISLLVSFKAYCQVDSLNYGPEPIGGINKIALEYFRIDFSPEQRKILQNAEIEFIYTIDEDGVPTLEEINGVTEKSILDSLQKVTDRLPRFHPRTVNGEKESSLYFIKLEFPKYRVTENQLAFQNNLFFRKSDYEDFEYIHESGRRMDVLIGGMANSFLGKPAEYLAFGGGIKTEIMYSGKKGIGGGVVMSFYGNELKKEYPLTSTRVQNSAPPTLFIGLGLNKSLEKRERSEFMVQLELNYAIQNVTPPLDPNDKEWVQLNGFSPGVVAHYFIQLGKNKMVYSYGSPSIARHYLNFHGAIRPLFFNLKEASGIMWELGLSYRLANLFVDEYRLKPEFSNF